jgi:hypothetical protein
MWHEYVGNIHLHTVHSDGHATHEQVVSMAADAGLDFVIPTDHNVYVAGRDGWYGNTLLLVGEEIHDVRREPQADHYLVFNVGQEMVQYAPNPQALIDSVNARGGLGFIAHPFERTSKYAGEPEINWESWEVSGFTGLSIWNYMSELKGHVHSLPITLLAVYVPSAVMSGPFPETLAKWDQLLRERPTPALCASDAHGTTYRLGPLRRVVLPYEDVFCALNTHILTRERFNRELTHDAALVYEALGRGRGFVGYDGIGSTRGFRFSAHSGTTDATMGEEIVLCGEVTLKIAAPSRCHIELRCNGVVVAQTHGTTLSHRSEVPGVYRVEAYRRHWLKRRGWIFSNPIYVKPS